MSLKGLIEKQIEEGEFGQYEYFSDSGWLDSPSEDELKGLYNKYVSEAKALVKEASELLGSPVHDASYFEDWFPEAIYAEGWQKEGKVIFIFVEHHDHETPVAVGLGAVRLEEIEEIRV